MLNVKLVVLLFFIATVKCYREYCGVCYNHTLCKYESSEPSINCLGYEKSAALTEHDISEIVNKINERRNFIALGLSRTLPQAANMRKIVWSSELARFAQRWADQCDPDTRPDREDDCRNLVNRRVGQNIVSITGPTSGLNVKSLIDVWFMQILKYNGSVSFYDKSHDANTKYFTQLIWAETDSVGCGKVKFQIIYTNTIIERLICNFAPKGNENGKTVYAIGFPATQCPKCMSPDKKFRGLCSRKRKKSNELASTERYVSSSLRILNLSNNTSMYEIDPINNHKLVKQENYTTSKNKNQKIRHVFFNNTYTSQPFAHALPMHWHQYHTNNSRIPGFRRFHEEPENSRINLQFNPKDNQRLYQELNQKENSRIYQELNQKDNIIPLYNTNTEPNFRRKNFPTEMPLPMPFPVNNYRKQFAFPIPLQCTRRRDLCPYPGKNGCDKKCTRVQCAPPNLCAPAPPMPMPPPMPPPMAPPMPPPLPPPPPPLPPNCICGVPGYCPSPCSPPYPAPLPPLPPPLLPPPLFPQCCTTNCQCPATAPCSNVVRSQEEIPFDSARKGDFHYYDLFPDLAMRSGEIIQDKHTSTTKKNTWTNEAGKDNPTFKTLIQHRKKNNQNNKKVIDYIDYAKISKQENDYSFGIFDSSERRRREPDDQITFKPFWQVDSYKLPPPLKAIKYTTLSRKIKQTSNNFVTESITIKLKGSASNDHDNHNEHKTEKYLSFDELMHLRRFDPKEYEARRADAKTPPKNIATKATTTTKPSTKPKPVATTTKTTPKTTTEKYTVNTPYIRKKHCTRKLTCTWTAPTVTGPDGKVIDGGGGGNRGAGSRTPPGYVEGCTRTSTCTRDYLNRNKQWTTATSTGDGEDGDPDEDYCEKRALNVQKRSSDYAKYLQNPLKKVINDDFTISPTSINYKDDVTEQNHNEPIDLNYCDCNQNNVRSKRHCGEHESFSCSHNVIKNHLESPLSYGDVYYLVLNKIMRTWEDNKETHSEDCDCNNTNIIQTCKLLLVTVVTIFNIFLNKLF